jgi:hypothetical protein
MPFSDSNFMLTFKPVVETLGCVAAGYRLAGEDLDRICCQHLYARDRMLMLGHNQTERWSLRCCRPQPCAFELTLAAPGAALQARSSL